MKKKIVTLFVAVLLFVSLLPQTAFAEDSQAGGLDFYSITLHFDGPTVVSYKKVTARDKLITYINSKGITKYKGGYIFGDTATEFVVRAGDTKDTAYTLYKNDARAGTNWYVAYDPEGSIQKPDSAAYSKFPFSYAYITGIQDGTVLQTKNLVNLRGIMEVSDDKGDPNPNVLFADNGYALAMEKDENGEYYLIDTNGYRITEDLIWYDAKGRRVELFDTEEDSDDPTEWISIKDKRRVSEDSGLIKKIEPTDNLITYTIKEVWDMNNDGVIDDADKAIYNDPEHVFTADDIYVEEFSGQMLRGAPVTATPQMKTKLVGISIEFDALGTEIYTDLTADPQQQNSIILTIGDYYKNIVETQKYFNDNFKGVIPDSVNNGRILSTLKSQTTRTSADFSKENKSEDGTQTKTTKSLYFEIDEEALQAITKAEYIYLNFNIATQQGAEAYNTEYLEKDALLDIKVKPFDSSKYPPEPEPSNNLFLIITIVVAAVLVVAVVLIILLVNNSKKKKKAAQIAEAAPQDTAETAGAPQIEEPEEKKEDNANESQKE